MTHQRGAMNITFPLNGFCYLDNKLFRTMPRPNTKQISIKEYGYLCGVAAARGSFYDRYKAQAQSKKG